VVVGPQRLLNQVGDLAFVTADRLDVNQGPKQLDDITVDIERRRHERHPTASVGSGP
jgi:hypothetical protein